MEQILDKLGQATGVIGCCLTGLDGLVIAGRMGGGMETDLVAATVADLYRNVSDSFEKLDGAMTQLLTIERQQDKMFVQRLDLTDTLLVVLTEPKINLGLVRMEIQQAAQKLKAQL